MKKVIPKIPKAKGLFKHLSWFDMIYLSICAVVALIIFFSNLGVVKYIVLVVFALAVGATEIRKDGISFANTMFYRIKAFTNPQIYVKGDNQTETLQGMQADERFSNSEVNKLALEKSKTQCLSAYCTIS